MHVSDADLLLAAEGELEPARAAVVAEHLARCQTCRKRVAALDLALAAYARDRHKLPGAAALAPTPLSWSRGAAIAVLAGIVAFSGGALFQSLLPPSGASAAGPIPDNSLTPGATRAAVGRETVCAGGGRDQAAVKPALARAVFARYGIANPQPRAYEVDYLITPALGGAEGDVRNLWPQPYEAGVWTARVKDALEDRLLSMVCSGELDLATAQREIAADWITAYKKYFGAAAPLGSHVAFVKDQPWEGY
jgi:hypothetical protein